MPLVNNLFCPTFPPNIYLVFSSPLHAYILWVVPSGYPIPSNIFSLKITLSISTAMEKPLRASTAISPSSATPLKNELGLEKSCLWYYFQLPTSISEIYRKCGWTAWCTNLFGKMQLQSSAKSGENLYFS